MPKFIKFNAYYGTFWEYYSTPNKALLFFTSVTNNVNDVEVLNEPILDWDISKAGNVTFKLPPCNVGYSAIQCKQGHIFIEQNGELIWHGRAITDTFDEDSNREITCEGALNYLLDTHVKPLNIVHRAQYRDLFEDLLNCHNRSLTGAESLIFEKTQWKKLESNGTVTINEIEIMINSNGETGWGLGVWSNPSMWRYKDHVGRKVRISFKATKYGSGSCDFRYGLHLRDTPWFSNTTRVAQREGPYIYETQTVSYTTFLGNGGLNGAGHEDAYIGFHMYLNADSGVSMRITNLKVEFYNDYHDQSDKVFPAGEGSRTGIYRIPNAYTTDAKTVNIADYPTTLDAINTIFINEYGGYLRVGYEPNEGDLTRKHPVLNYIYGTTERDSPGDNLPEIRYGKNLISLKETTNYEDYPTVIIPLGRQKEPWEKALAAPNVTYTSGKYLDKDGVIQSSSNGKYYIAQLPVLPDEVYFIYGEGVNDLGLYSVVDSSYNVLDHKTFSNSEGNWYQHVEVDIPAGAANLIVFFNNETQAATITTKIFKVQKYNYEDLDEYITLEGLNVIEQDGSEITLRDDELAGSKYYPVIDMPHIYTYGWIEQVVHFDDAETQRELLGKVSSYCHRLQEAIKTYEVEAAELAPISGDDDYIPIGMPGSYGKLIVPKMQIDKTLCVTKASVNLRNFAKSSYSLANLPPPDLADLIAKGLY